MKDACCECLPYKQTNSFSKLIQDYLDGAETLDGFYAHAPNFEGIKASVTARRQHVTDRKLLVDALKMQYANYELTTAQRTHLDALLADNTFTITTAHQPNIFTGPLYFIYKILHAVKLAKTLESQLSDVKLVPIYYMGSEDADLDELGHIFIDGEKISWDTNQTGAVGRMNTKGLEKIIQRLEGQFGDLPFGKEMVLLCRKAYTEQENIQQATLFLVNELFKKYGLLVVIPDNPKLKDVFNEIIKQELSGNFSAPLVKETIAGLSMHYKIQVEGRPINLFYLDEKGNRERIEKENENWVVKSLGLTFSESEILRQVDEHPEHFSANVILRGLFQEMILPNIAFVGGGGEIAYWLELKRIFEKANVPYPVLILRNSFMLLNERMQQIRSKLDLSLNELFEPELALLDKQVEKVKGEAISLSKQEQEIYQLYSSLQQLAQQIDSTLQPHVAALHTKSLKGIRELEKKLKRAARRKLDEEGRSIRHLKSTLFPGGGLQERVENFMPFYAAYGPAILDLLLDNSLSLEQQFCLLPLPASNN